MPACCLIRARSPSPGLLTQLCHATRQEFSTKPSLSGSLSGSGREGFKYGTVQARTLIAGVIGYSDTWQRSAPYIWRSHTPIKSID